MKDGVVSKSSVAPEAHGDGTRNCVDRKVRSPCAGQAVGQRGSGIGVGRTHAADRSAGDRVLRQCERVASRAKLGASFTSLTEIVKTFSKLVPPASVVRTRIE